MAKMKEHPRYHVVSFRITDEEKEQLDNILAGKRTIDNFMYETFKDKLRRLKYAE